MHIMRGVLVLSVCSAWLAVLSPVHAIDLRRGDTVTVPSGQTVEGSIIAAGNTIVIDGSVTGDVYCAAKSVTINGAIGGDVLCAGQQVAISGAVSGNVRLAGQTVMVSSKVARSSNLFGQTVAVGQSASVSGEMIAFGQAVDIGGQVGDDVLLGGETVTVHAPVNGDITAYANRAYFNPGASIAGSVTVTSPHEIRISPDASVSGSVERIIPSQPAAPRASRIPGLSGKGFSVVWFLVKVFVFVLLGLAVVVLAPSWTGKTLAILESRTAYAFVIGVAVCLFLPIVLVTAAITLIGIPVFVLGGFVFAFALLVSRVMVAVYIGRRILTAWRGDSTLTGSVVLGVPVVWLLFQIPVAGVFLTLFAVCAGIGSMTLALRRTPGSGSKAMKATKRIRTVEQMRKPARNPVTR